MVPYLAFFPTSVTNSDGRFSPAIQFMDGGILVFTSVITDDELGAYHYACQRCGEAFRAVSAVTDTWKVESQSR